MRIQLDQSKKSGIKIDRKYCHELLAIMAHFEQIKRNPQSIVHPVTNTIPVYIALSSIMCIFFFYEYIMTEIFLFLVFMLVFLGIIIYAATYLHRISRTLKVLRDNQRQHRALTIEKDYINLTNSENNLQYQKRNLKWIIANHYTIAFIPNKPNLPLTAVSIHYKKTVFNALRKYGYEKLIIDNSHKYAKSKQS